MSGLGKIFVVLNLVFSLVIVGAAAAYLSHADNWKTKHDELNAKFSSLEKERDQAVSDRDTQKRLLTEEIAGKQNEIEDLKIKVDDATTQLKDERIGNQQLRDDVTRINSTLQNFQTNMNEVQSRNNELVDMNAQLRNQALDAQQKQKEAEDELTRVQGELDQANARIQAMEAQLTQIQGEKENLSNLLNVAKSQGFSTSENVAMPEIDAYVSDVNNEEGFVILNVGSEDKVERGFTFQVYRGDRYLGEVVVDDLFPKSCAALIRSTVNGAQIQKNDRASTLL
jgi:chromosome segregation ATPase